MYPLLCRVKKWQSFGAATEYCSGATPEPILVKAVARSQVPHQSRVFSVRGNPKNIGIVSENLDMPHTRHFCSTLSYFSLTEHIRTNWKFRRTEFFLSPGEVLEKFQNSKIRSRLAAVRGNPKNLRIVSENPGMPQTYFRIFAIFVSRSQISDIRTNWGFRRTEFFFSPGSPRIPKLCLDRHPAIGTTIF
mgnify:CR=1 FL=1